MPIIKVLLLIAVLFFLAGFTFSDEKIFSSYTGKTPFFNIAKPVSPPNYGVVINGNTMTFLPYTGVNIHYKNIITYLKPQTPVVITAESLDGLFYFVETNLASGFIPQKNTSIVDINTFNKLTAVPSGLLKKPIVIDDINLPIATKLPIIQSGKNRYKVRILTPTVKDVWLNSKFFTKPVSLNKKNFLKIASLFKKKSYFWGSSENAWDCSGLLLDYFAFFDIEIPRNSYQQINFFKKVDVSNKNAKEKERILKKSKPYLTLLYFPGHIMLYTGKKGKELMTFQALNRLNNKKYGYVGYFPLKKTGLLARVTNIGFVEKYKPNLTSQLFENKIEVSN